QPTAEFIAIVTQRVEEFLAGCAAQQVLQPTGCPFGVQVHNRLSTLPTWSITSMPAVTVAPDGPHWRIPAAEGIAHLEVDVQSLFDGSKRSVSEDVPFELTGTIDILPDGSASIIISSGDGDHPTPDT